MIVKTKRRGRTRWLLVASNRVYEHPTKAAAEAQERAINLSKARKAGHRIPKRKATH